MFLSRNIDTFLPLFQDADDVDHVCTHPEIVRVPDPEILLVLKCFFFFHMALLVDCSCHYILALRRRLLTFSCSEVKFASFVLG